MAEYKTVLITHKYKISGKIKKEKAINFYTIRKKRTFAKIIKNIDAMARPIKETPVITGKDAERFAEKMKNLIPESKEEIECGRKAYEELKAIASFDF